MLEKIKFGDLKEDVKSIKKTNQENSQCEYVWPQYDSSLIEIGSTFYKVLPEEYVGELNKKIYTTIEEYGEAFKKYIEDSLSKNPKKERTAIEFGGPGSNLFFGFSDGFFSKTVGICLDDIRSEVEKDADNLRGHSVVIGDIIDTKNRNLFNEINNKIGADKADLIISRIQGPLNKLKINEAVLDRVIRKWYQLLDKNGILFAQFVYLDEHDPYMENKYNALIEPPYKSKTEKIAEMWVDAIKLKYPNEIDVSLGRGVIRLVKKDNAPEELASNNELFGIQQNLA